MKPGDLVRIKFAGHHLVGRTALVIDLNSGPYEGWLMILIDGKTIKVPDAWVEYETG